MYYVVWKGWKTGIFDNYYDYKKQVNRYRNAQHMSFSTLKEAEEAYKKGFSLSKLKRNGDKHNTVFLKKGKKVKL